MRYKSKIMLLLFTLHIFFIHAEESPLKLAKFKTEFSYLTFPLSAAGGIFTAYKNFSLFSKIGINYDTAEEMKLNSFCGIDFNYKNYLLKTSFEYNLLDNGFNFAELNNKTFAANGKISIPLPNGNFEIPFKFGQKPFLQNQEQIKQIYIQGGIGFNFLLFDNGYYKINSSIQNNFSYLYKENFVFSELKFNIKSIYYTRYFDFASAILFLDMRHIYNSDSIFTIEKKNRFSYRKNWTNGKKYTTLFGHTPF